MNIDLKIEAIFEDQLYTTSPLMQVIVAKLNGSRQDIPRAFRLTKDFVSNAELKHLRRIKDLENGTIECIVCKLDKNDKVDESIKNLEDKFEHEKIFEDYRLQLVPSKAPRTEHQWTECSKFWPCKYAKSNYLIQCIEGTVFSSAERLVLKVIVDQLLKRVIKKENTNQSAAVIFRFARIYGAGLTNEDVIECNPTKHSSMLAIDSVASNAGGGNWNHSYNQVANDLIEAIQQQLDKHHNELEHHRIDSKFLPYLCTNYDVIVTEEPCMMCTMGLVQSRIRRLFYLDMKSHNSDASSYQSCYNDGAVERFMVHRDKNLNHRFEAWRLKINIESIK